MYAPPVFGVFIVFILIFYLAIISFTITILIIPSALQPLTYN